MTDRFPWRTRRKVGRTIYQQVGSEPSDDNMLIGVMNTPELAYEVVTARNFARVGLGSSMWRAFGGDEDPQ